MIGRCNSFSRFLNTSVYKKADLPFCSIHSCFLCKTHTPAGFQDRRAGREHGSGSVICCASCGNVYLHAKLRTVLFFLFCMRATLLFCSNSNLFKLLYNLVFKPSACTASSLSSYFAIQDAEEVVYCISVSISSPHRPLKRFKSPQGKFQ